MYRYVSKCIYPVYYSKNVIMNVTMDVLHATYQLALRLLSSIYTATCTDLPTLSNGVIVYSTPSSPRPQGTTAIYSCNTGYELSGGMFRTCQSDRAWSGGSITCQREISDCDLNIRLVIPNVWVGVV